MTNTLAYYTTVLRSWSTWVGSWFLMNAREIYIYINIIIKPQPKQDIVKMLVVLVPGKGSQSFSWHFLSGKRH
jgi:hypothetical protein